MLVEKKDKGEDVLDPDHLRALEGVEHRELLAFGKLEHRPAQTLHKVLVNKAEGGRCKK
jgi:hypothetical protein